MSKLFLLFKNLFKKKPEVVLPPPRSEQEIANDKHRSKYRTEFFEGVHYVQYYFNGEWWYLRLFDEEYVFEDRRGKALRFVEMKYLEQIITNHQEWLSTGKRFLPF